MQTIMAFDFGRKNIGVAVGNTLLCQAQALQTLVVRADEHWVGIAALLREWQPQALVVGVPYHPDGAAHSNTRLALAFAQQLKNRFGLPVHMQDERYSTCEALSAQWLAGSSKAAQSIDARSAAVILQQYLDLPISTNDLSSP